MDHTPTIYPIPAEGPRDPILAEMLPEFLDSWKKDLTHVWTDIQSRADSTELYRLGHTIKGSFIQFGFGNLAQAGRDVMADAESSNWDSARTHIEALLLVVNTMIANKPSTSLH